MAIPQEKGVVTKQVSHADFFPRCAFSLPTTSRGLVLRDDATRLDHLVQLARGGRRNSCHIGQANIFDLAQWSGPTDEQPL
jgi:hypothetical protein